VDRLHIRVHLWWGSRRWARRRLLAVTGARCPLKKPAVAAVELQQVAAGSQTNCSADCSRGVQPGGICAHVAQHEPATGGTGPR
jgi:hypothetical protein